jgi:hypothetical protein
MNKKIYLLMLPIVASQIFSGCAGSKFGSAKAGEKVEMKCHNNKNLIHYTAIASQGQPADLTNPQARGLLTSFTGGLVSLGISSVKSMIDNHKKKYTDTWMQGLNNNYFYFQPSSNGAFDPAGMQFEGFVVTRMFKRKKTDKDSLVALTAEFVVDTTNAKEIINDGVFRLKLKHLRVYYSKAKVPEGKNELNLDFTITFTTSYITQDGLLNKDVTLGKFVYSLRNAPIDSASDPEKYVKYYTEKENKAVSGESFIVPRSYGYYKENNTLTPYWNQGSYSILLNVTESSKEHFVDQLAVTAGDMVLTAAPGVLTPKTSTKK